MSFFVFFSLIAQVSTADAAKAPACCFVEQPVALQRFPIIPFSDLIRLIERERPLGAVSRFNARVRG
jgi:hypothetical protein